MALCASPHCQMLSPLWNYEADRVLSWLNSSFTHIQIPHTYKSCPKASDEVVVEVQGGSSSRLVMFERLRSSESTALSRPSCGRAGCR